jgi:hypothetical protein
MTRVRQIAVPSEAKARSTLDRVDYADAFLVETAKAQDRTAEEWARAIFDGAPTSMQRKLRLGWQSLGLKLGPALGDRFVIGWELRRSTPDVVLLGAGSRIGMPAELLVERRDGELLFTTFVRQDNLLARAVWAATEPLHVPVVQRVLAGAARHHG